MPALRVAFLWHQHQPYYRADGRFILPWAWLHATKDYIEMAQHLERVPNMRATINLVPSLLKQMEEYLDGTASDEYLDAMRKPSSELSDGEKHFILDHFFNAEEGRSIDRSPRYRELLERRQKCSTSNGIDLANFSEEDLRDLTVHFALAWTGEFARKEDPAKSLVAKDRGFSDAERAALMDYHRTLVGRTVPLHRSLQEKGQLELTTSPFYHPILPLLIDTDSARESMPHALLPDSRFAFPADAELQLSSGRTFASERFGKTPNGVWPSEGSLSEATLELLVRAGYDWTASDELILERSLGKGGQKVDYPHLAKFFPWKYETPSGPIHLFFRDHGLSDMIGFDYRSWRTEDAVGNFIESAKSIRNAILEAFGEDGVAAASLNIILDGENCWEYYPENGYWFLSGLYDALTRTPELTPATFGEIARSTKSDKPGGERTLSRLRAGSWIDGNFAVWIGHPQEGAAWDALFDAKEILEKHRETPKDPDDEKKFEGAHEELLKAEGSDWFWWYGDDHASGNKFEFDQLFRVHVRKVYELLGEPVPDYLNLPIAGRISSRPVPGDGDGWVSPQLHGSREGSGWENARSLTIARPGAMQRAASSGLAAVRAGWNHEEMFLRVLPLEHAITRIKIEFRRPSGYWVMLSREVFELRLVKSSEPFAAAGRGILRDSAEFALPRSLFGPDQCAQFALHAEFEDGTHTRVPHADWFECVLR